MNSHRATLRYGSLKAVHNMQVRLERDMLDNAYVERTRQVLSAIRRGTHTSDAMAMQWMQAAQGAATFLQVCAAADTQSHRSPTTVPQSHLLRSSGLRPSQVP